MLKIYYQNVFVFLVLCHSFVRFLMLLLICLRIELELELESKIWKTLS